MVMGNLRGTVQDMTPEIQGMYETMVEGGYQGSFEDYISNRRFPLLSVRFDKAVRLPNGSTIGGVPLEQDSIAAKLVRPGQRVEVSIEPGPPGFKSELLSIRPLSR